MCRITECEKIYFLKCFFFFFATWTNIALSEKYKHYQIFKIFILLLLNTGMKAFPLFFNVHIIYSFSALLVEPHDFDLVQKSFILKAV